MIFAGGLIQKGYAVAYAADAKVIHSHNYSGVQQFHRNFDLAVSQAEHPEVFSGGSFRGRGNPSCKKYGGALCPYREAVACFQSLSITVHASISDTGSEKAGAGFRMGDAFHNE